MIHKRCYQPVSSTQEHPNYFGYAGSPLQGYYCYECSSEVHHSDVWYGTKDSLMRHRDNVARDIVARDLLRTIID